MTSTDWAALAMGIMVGFLVREIRDRLHTKRTATESEPMGEQERT